MTTAKKTTRAKRSATTREDETRRKPWTPPAMLDVPEPPAGYRYRWIRSEMMGELDKGNISKRFREGFEPVRPDELGEGFELPTIDDGKHAGVVGVGGLILAKIPLETVEERRAYFSNKTNEQLQAIDAELAKESNAIMPIGAPQRKSQTSFGNPENKPSLED